MLWLLSLALPESHKVRKTSVVLAPVESANDVRTSDMLSRSHVINVLDVEGQSRGRRVLTSSSESSVRSMILCF